MPVPELENADTTLGSHIEIEPIGTSDETGFENLTTFALTPEDNILACDAQAKEIKVLDPNGKTLALFGVSGFPSMVLLNSECQVMATSEGARPDYEEALKNTLNQLLSLKEI